MQKISSNKLNHCFVWIQYRKYMPFNILWGNSVSKNISNTAEWDYKMVKGLSVVEPVA